MKDTFTKEDLKKAYENIKETCGEIKGFNEWFEYMYPSTREGMLSKLERQYKTEFAGKWYKANFKADAYLTECNFGGLLIILCNSEDFVVVWSDWGGMAVSTELTECEIEYHDAEDGELDENGFPVFIAQFHYNDTWYSLQDFMKIN